MTGFTVELRRKTYPAMGDAPARTIYADFRLEVAAGDFVCLLGPSGAGKTTLLNMVAGLDPHFEGAVSFAGALPRIAYAFQNPRLLPWRTVLENVALPLPAGPQARGRALALLEEMGLLEAQDVYPERLSLGMQRRAALARAFAVEPDLLLMDEPFVSLDEANAERLRELLAATLSLRPTTVLFVTHDSSEAIRLGDRIVVLAGAPARIRRDLRVPLSAEDRGDARKVDAFRQSEMMRGDITAERPGH